ncbi:S-layer homology domain-containing protein [Deinococcus yavapaiensis]|uniref:S-layer family protein n=1 Tax=Deinococcus yavapaiensis KR-236 TaxID=694435 RepID=A0A318RZ80_9DEIO|nr:S-layer homology domain-containing protein [Deinococcus yavapaiensis]PYE48669.1 S-layer family protein [Deinococcus yavapaiensis KR-236]
MKLKALLTLTAALSFGVAAAQESAPAAPAQAPATAAPALSDVPAGHWAKDAVDRLVQQGIVLGFPDGTFRGTQSLTRYQAAVIIARLLDQIAKNEPAVQQLDPETITSLQNAVQELAADLAALGVRVADLEENAATKDDLSTLEETINSSVDSKIEEAINNLEIPGSNDDAIEELRASIDEVNTRIEELSGRVDEVAGSVDEVSGRVDEVAGSVDEVSGRVDEVAGSVDEVSGRVDEVAGSVDEVSGRVDEVSGRVDEVAGSVEDLTGRVDELADNYDALRADVDDAASSIAALNDLTVLLNQDILSLQDRVSAIEADYVPRADFDNLTARVGAVETRVTTAETNITNLTNQVNQLNRFAFRVSGNISLSYYQAQTFGDLDQDFDIDRLLPGTNLSSGTNGADNSNPRDFADFARNTGNVVNTRDNFASTNSGDRSGAASVGASVSFGFLNNPVLRGANNTTLTFGIRPQNGSGTLTAAPDGALESAPLVFFVTGLASNFTFGNAPVTITAGLSPTVKFTEYVFDNDVNSRGPGIVATVDGSNLPVIGAFRPTITATFGTTNNSNIGVPATVNAPITPTPASGPTTSPVNVAAGAANYFGVRAAITPIDTLRLGINYVQEGFNANGGVVPGTATTLPVQLGYQGVAGATGRTVFGLSANGGLAGVNIDSEYVTSQLNGTSQTDQAFYARVGTTIAGISLGANFRSIDPDFANGGVTTGSPTNAGLSTDGLRPDSNGDGVFGGAGDNNQALFGANQTGFGVRAGVTIAGIDLRGYFDQSAPYTTFGTIGTTSGANGTGTRFGASLATTLGPVTVGGYFESRSDNDGVGVAAAQRFGVGATVALPAGFRASAGYNQASEGGVQVETTGFFAGASALGIDRNIVVPAAITAALPTVPAFAATPLSGFVPAIPGSSNTFFGVTLRHDGTASDALIRGLNLDFGYRSQFRAATGGFTRTVLNAGASYSGNLLGATLNAGGAYIADNYGSETSATTDSSTTLIAAASLTTPTFDFIFRPALTAEVQTASRAFQAQAYTASLTRTAFGVTLNDVFGLANTTASVQAANLDTNNVIYNVFTSGGAGSFSPSAAAGANNLRGIYTNLAIGGANVSYGLFTLTTDSDAAAPQSTTGQAFRVSYNIPLTF